MGLFSADAQLVGYKYYMGLHIQSCIGVVDELRGIIAGERVVWDTTVTSNEQIYINKSGIFGGVKKEGGIQGYIDVEFGGADQSENDYLQSAIPDAPAKIPAFRGAFGLVCRKIYICAGSPYIKPWWLKLYRLPGKDWYPAKAAIGTGAANPAHMLYECYTSKIWGLGYNTVIINDSQFQAAADTLYDEGFGLAMILAKPSDVESFIGEIENHIQAVTGYDHETGLVGIKLIRGDYDPDEIPEFRTDDGTLASVSEYKRPSPGEIVNQINLVYRRRGEVEDTTITDQNLASIAAQGATIQNTVDYPGINDDDLAAKVLSRDLQKYSAPVAAVKAKLNRSAWNLKKADVCRLIWDDPNLGTISMIVRVLEIDYGTLESGIISVSGAQDIFSLDEYACVSPQAPAWSDPVTAPVAMVYHGIMELTYWDIYNIDPARIDELESTYGWVQYYGVIPADSAFSFDFYVAVGGGESLFQDTAGFVPAASLSQDIGYLDSTDIDISSSSFDTETPPVGSYALIDNEIVRIDAIDTANSIISIGRGCLDTVAAPHSTGAIIFAVETFRAVSETVYLKNQNIVGEGRTRTSLGVLLEGDAPDDALTIQARQDKPYPPGLFRINAAAYPETISGALTVSWAHRDREQQTVTIIDESAGNIGPESGTTYSLNFYNENDVLSKSVTGETGTDYEWATEVADSGLGRLNAEVRVELWAVRDGVDSFQKHDFTVERNMAPVNLTLPEITGDTDVDDVLTCSTGGWTGSPTEYDYQWYRDDVLISGAEASTHTVVTADQGTVLTCTSEASNAYGDSDPAESAGVSILADAYTGKTVAFDIADNHGDTTRLGLMHVVFKNDGETVELSPSDYTAYATSTYGSYSNYSPTNVFDTDKAVFGNIWADSLGWYANGTTNQRITIVCDSEITFTDIVVNNVYHMSPFKESDRGANNMKVTVSPDAASATVGQTYEGTITNSSEIFDGQLDEHSQANEADDQVLTLT